MVELPRMKQLQEENLGLNLVLTALILDKTMLLDLVSTKW